ncbi:phosphate ABC transporter substrate-binding/OmpA family protein [Marinobacter sp. SS21]|uniref:phosphate ABC transporter substrate-binding/OmpA family protein n=1 Tax=Marinobacter sp. SS21 TaxID=2979460 RepID=UPI00232C815F|nr:phosphate ABC transporter substrate-binding/OmpA family protein [Marinobacter sp. SS21]MDC0662921.1 phosphate ABC transporter substrate-binding/OmpA family protein [Marinobacter sp. SS21]
MNTHTRIATALLIFGLISLGGYKTYLAWSEESRQLQATDARNTKGMITVARDSWVGYFPLCSPEMTNRLRRQGYLLECVDDQANYEERFRKLARGDYSFVVATVDSYLQNGAAHNFPGPIVTVIDESKGGDAIVARADKWASIDALKNSDEIRIAFTPDSPSEHLLRALRSHFDLTTLNQNGHWRVPVQGSREALDELLQQRVDIAVLWEPEVTMALAQPGMIRLLGTEDTQKLIVDVLIANPRVLQDQPDLAKAFLKTYFQVQQHYRRHPQELIQALRNEYQLTPEQLENLLDGVSWKTLTDNVHDWFGGSQTGAAGHQHLVDAIDSAIHILTDDGVFDRSPLPGNDPYRLINSSLTKALYHSLATGNLSGSSQNPNRFRPLDNEEWAQLRPVGLLKVEPIAFASGTAEPTAAGQREIDNLMQSLQHYPNFRVEIRGHTGTRGDQEANQALSQARADAVLRYIDASRGAEPHRFRSVGFGGSRPLAQLPNESSRAYSYRLPRVEIALLSGDL